MLSHRPLGRSGITIAPLMFGGNVFGWTADEAMSFRMLDAFVAGGFNAIDTADVYSRWVPRYETLQPEYNLMERAGFEAELQGLCAREEIGTITYFSLAKGFLTGKYRSEADLGKSPRGGGVKGYLTSSRGKAVLAALDEVAAAAKATPAQVALSWLLGRPAVTAPIASATSLAQLEEIMGGARLTLSPEAIAKLTEASA